MAQRAATDNQMKYINKLITDRELTTEEVQKIIEHIGATSLDNLNIAQASDMIDVLKESWVRILHPEEFEEFDPDSLEPMTQEEIEEMFANEQEMEAEHKKEENQDLLTKIAEHFEVGVQEEYAKPTLKNYLKAGAKTKLAWEREGNTYIVKILVSMVEDVDYFEPLGFVFGNQDLDDTSAFDDGKNGDRADESDPFERCENELLKRFGITRDNLEEISVCW